MGNTNIGSISLSLMMFINTNGLAFCVQKLGRFNESLNILFSSGLFNCICLICERYVESE